MPETRCAAVILAAGASTRLGQAKQLIHVGGESLLRRTTRLAVEAGCAPVVVVLGFEAERLRTELAGLDAEGVVNREWREGMGTSLRCGMEAIFGAGTSGGSLESRAERPPSVLLLVCDQPRLTAKHMRELLTEHAASGLAITASGYAGRAGVPAVFAGEVVPELLQCAGDQGAREVIRRDPARVQVVAWPEGAVDVDRTEDMEGLTGA